MRRVVIAIALVSSFASARAAEPTREEKVRTDKAKVEAEGYWIYNDLEKGFAEAKATGKPMLVIMRCIPCVECVKLDDDLINQDARVKPLLEKFVRVRVVSTNGLDLSLFQFDTDQSWAAFIFNADRTIYGRFGTRSHHSAWTADVSVEGLAKALAGALELHLDYPKNKGLLAAKKGPAPEYPSPAQHPLLRDKYKATLNYQGNVVQSCIHCHQIGDVAREAYRNRGEPLPMSLLFSYPHPKAIGLILDPKEKATVERVEAGTPAAESGFKAGDVIVSLADQPLLSIADVQWVLHRADATGATLKARVLRDGNKLPLTLKLPAGWREKDDISWRVSTWNLRKMATGGLLLEAATAEERAKAGVGEKGMALRAKHVGQYGDHAAAQRAGFRKDDILVAFDGRDDLMRETDLIAYAINQRKAGEKVKVSVMRAGKRLEFELPMQR